LPPKDGSEVPVSPDLLVAQRRLGDERMSGPDGGHDRNVKQVPGGELGMIDRAVDETQV
jgi:hypothetical protein